MELTSTDPGEYQGSYSQSHNDKPGEVHVGEKDAESTKPEEPIRTIKIAIGEALRTHKVPTVHWLDRNGKQQDGPVGKDPDRPTVPETRSDSPEGSKTRPQPTDREQDKEDAAVPEPRSTVAGFRLPERIGSLLLNDRWLSPPDKLGDNDRAAATARPEPATDAASLPAGHNTPVDAATPPLKELRKAAAAARNALLVSERVAHTHPPIEFRIAVSKADREADEVAWFPIEIIEPSKPLPTGESGANLPTEEKLDEKWRGLLWGKTEHTLLADGTWRVVKCEVAQSAQSTDLAPSFEIQITLDAVGGALLRRLTSTHLDQSLAIVVDGTIVAAPVLRTEFGDDVVITGSFSIAAAEKLAAAIRKPDLRKRASCLLHFVDAKSAVAALKIEAASRKIRGFEATIDPRLNAVAITADADTLDALREILVRLDSADAPENEWPPRDPVKLLERLRLRDAEFDRRSLQSERRWVIRVGLITPNTNEPTTGSRRHPGSRMFERSQFSNVATPYNQPHRVPYLLTFLGRGDAFLSDVVIDNADDLETMTDPRFEPAVKSDRWPERPQVIAFNTAMMEGLILETQRLSSNRQAFEWSTGFGFAKRIVSIDDLRVKDDRVVISGKSRVFDLGPTYPQGSPPPPHHDSQYQMEMDSDFIVRKAEFSLTAFPEVHQRIIPYYDRIQSILIETFGIVRPTDAPPVAAEGNYRLIVQKPDKSPHTYHKDRFTFGALSARLTDDELSQRTAPTRAFYSVGAATSPQTTTPNDAENLTTETQGLGRIEGQVLPLPELKPVKLDESQKLALERLLPKVGNQGPLLDPKTLAVPEVTVQFIELHVDGGGVLMFSSAKPDDDGKFVFENVPSGLVMLNPIFRVGNKDGVQIPTALLMRTTVFPGEATTFSLFGKGRPITGRVTLPSTFNPEDCRIELHYAAPPMRDIGEGDLKHELAWHIHAVLDSEQRGAKLDKQGDCQRKGRRSLAKDFANRYCLGETLRYIN